ncbi:MAG: GGDEF domain-containing protein [Lachnospiraceae bacterium]|nr:GGDEF domain-containing protein [Lachnospiraceae bacterium]
MNDDRTLQKVNIEPQDDSYGKIIRGWQKGIFRINLYVIMLTFCIEVAFMFIIDSRGGLSVPIPLYIPLYIIRPTMINIATYLTAYFLNKKKELNIGVRAMIPLVLLTVIISNLIVVHYVFSALYSLIVVPIYVSVIYGNVRITRRIFWILIPVYIFDVICILLAPYKNLPEDFIYNVIVAFLVIPLSYLLVKSQVDYENKKEQLILHQSMVNDQLRDQIRYDGLTQIFNHTGLFEYLNEKIANYSQGDRLYIAVLDIDYFKKVNDDFGHESGNIVLKTLGQLMQQISNDNVLPARYGGEEFSLVFSDMSMEDVKALLTKLHRDFAGQRFIGIDRKITFSAGIAVYEEGMSDRTFFEKADKALYRAKNEGRNRIITAS